MRVRQGTRCDPPARVPIPTVRPGATGPMGEQKLFFDDVQEGVRTAIPDFDRIAAATGSRR